MTDCLVLREKLRPPEAAGLIRDRLTTELLAGSAAVLALVVAPAGCGKTTLLSQVAAAAPGPVAWYGVTADDSTETRFTAHVAAALGDVAAGGAFESMADLLGALDRWTGARALLILDDVHEIAGSPAERALERLVRLRPRRLRVICGARRTPDVNVSRLRVSGGLGEIGSEELRFRSWEVEELFASVYRTPLRPAAAAALTRSTDGWAAGLQLFHLATTGLGPAERHRAVAHLGGRSKLVRSYLTRNVLAGLPANRREFLVRTATLGRLSGPACDALLDTRGSHRVLEELEAAQLFTFTDDGGQVFRYHEVLRTHLELTLVEELGVADARRWYRRSAEVLEGIGEKRSAAQVFAKAGEWAAVSRLVRDGDGAGFGSCLTQAPAWRDDPWLALAEARRLVREGALARAVDGYRHARTLYDEPNFQRMCREEAKALSCWLPGGTGEPTAPGEHWSLLLREALRAAPDFAALQPIPREDVRTRFALGLAAVCAGEIDLARTVLSALGREETGDALVSIGASLLLTALDFVAAATAAAVPRLGAVTAMAESEGLPWIARLCRGLEQMTLITTTGALWRVESCADMVRSADEVGDPWGAGLLGFALALAKQRAGQDAGAEFEDCAKRFDDLDAPVLQLWCRLLALTGEVSVAAAQEALDMSRRLRVRGAHAFALRLLASTSAPSVAITCFGDYRLVVAGRLVALAALRPQARSVLQILSMARGFTQRCEFLEDALWPGVDHAVAKHRLQVAVSSVRGVLRGTGVAIERRADSYRLVLPDDAAVDVRDFTAAVARADTLSARGDIPGRVAARRRALDCYTGDLLPNLTGVDHVEIERDRLRRNAAAVAAALAADQYGLGDHGQALASARRSVQLDPYQDLAWQVLADVHTDLGDPGSAEFVRREHARVRAELGV
jgi:DNA-binding SARP family transcriptional activator